jgi:hypothetical protein
MASLKEKLSGDLKESMKAGDSTKVGTLRMILSAIQNRLIEKRAKTEEGLTDDEILDIFRKEAKKRKEAIEIYSKAGRDDLKDKEVVELGIIQVYLPPELSEADIEKIAKGAIKAGAKDFGGVMKVVMKESKGRADSGLASAIIKKLL